MRDLLNWLREQIAEDERRAHAAETRLNAWAPGLPDDFVARHTPASVLPQCEARAAMLDLHADNGMGVCSACTDTKPLAAGDCGGADHPCDALKALALAYRHRPGYREEWRT